MICGYSGRWVFFVKQIFIMTQPVLDQIKIFVRQNRTAVNLTISKYLLKPTPIMGSHDKHSHVNIKTVHTSFPCVYEFIYRLLQLDPYRSTHDFQFSK